MPKNRSWQLRLVCYWRRLTSAKVLFYPNRLGLGTHRATSCRGACDMKGEGVAGFVFWRYKSNG